MKKFIGQVISLILIILIGLNIFNIYKSSKSEVLLSKYIIDNNKLESTNNSYYFKNDDNYVLYNNLIWRIVRINNDSSIMIILNNYINMLKYEDVDTFFDKLKNNIDTTYLEKNKICIDTYEEDIITCNKYENNSYINLLSLYDYLNTSFISGNTLLNDKLYINNDGVSKINEDYYEIRPVVTLKRGTIYKSGDGKINNPYFISEDNLGIGKKVKYKNKEYIIISKDYELMSSEVIKDVYYKDIDKYLDNARIPNKFDIKIDNIGNYYLDNNELGFKIAYDNPVKYIDEDIKHDLRYIIKVDKKDLEVINEK